MVFSVRVAVHPRVYDRGRGCTAVSALPCRVVLVILATCSGIPPGYAAKSQPERERHTAVELN